MSDEEVAQIRAKEAELHALAEQKLKEADEKARQDEENDTIRVETGSPTGVADGPDSVTVSANQEEIMECA